MDDNKCDFFADKLNFINEFCDCEVGDCNVLDKRHGKKTECKQLILPDVVESLPNKDADRWDELIDCGLDKKLKKW